MTRDQTDAAAGVKAVCAVKLNFKSISKQLALPVEKADTSNGLLVEVANEMVALQRQLRNT